VIVLCLLCAAGVVAVHLKYPAAREAGRDAASNLVFGIGFGWIALRSWRERWKDMPTAVAWLVISAYSLFCALVGFVTPWRIVPWFVSPLAVMIVLLLAVAVGTRPQSPLTD
jgi:hypothetical protein